jgi:N-acetyl-gamma-glutamyl-phosphate reductase
MVPQLLDGGVKVIDLSADYRLKDPESYAHWYNQKHPDPDRLGKVAYGLPELFREEIRGSRLVANPGCFPTSAILPLAPLLKNGLIEPRGIIIDSKTGVSGAGRTPKLTTHYPECNESVSAYNIGRHRHTPEIDQILSRIAGQTVEVIFSPHLIPMDRGILTTTYSVPTRELREEELLQTLREFYKEEPFVRVVPHLPATKDSMNTNFCDITARIVRGRVVTISCLDNLIKGASGAAVQNFNIVYDYPETLALL